MSSDAPQPPVWLLDSSTFIHACLIDRVALLATLREPLCVPEYVYRWELCRAGHESTQLNAERWLRQQRLAVRQLSIADLDRMANLNAPRRISLGEIACAVLAERESGGVLCDDRRARRWLEPRVAVPIWQAIEDCLLDAAAIGHLGEWDLEECQQVLARHQYECSCQLRLEHLHRQANRRQPT